MARLGAKARSAGIVEEDAQLLETVAGCRGQVKRRKAVVLAAPVPLECAREACAEDLLSLPAVSNLEIASYGPRAAGKFLMQKLAGGSDRCLGPGVFAKTRMFSYRVCCQGGVAFKCKGAGNRW